MAANNKIKNNQKMCRLCWVLCGCVAQVLIILYLFGILKSFYVFVFSFFKIGNWWGSLGEICSLNNPFIIGLILDEENWVTRKKIISKNITMLKDGTNSIKTTKQFLQILLMYEIITRKADILSKNKKNILMNGHCKKCFIKFLWIGPP